MSVALIEQEHCQVVDVFAQFGTQTRANDDNCEIIARYASSYSAIEPPEQTMRLLGRALERIPALPSGQASENAAQDAAPVQEGGPPATQAGDTRPWWRRMFGR